VSHAARFLLRFLSGGSEPSARLPGLPAGVARLTAEVSAVTTLLGMLDTGHCARLRGELSSLTDAGRAVLRAEQCVSAVKAEGIGPRSPDRSR
jgi:hypothetical protein